MQDEWTCICIVDEKMQIQMRDECACSYGLGRTVGFANGNWDPNRRGFPNKCRITPTANQAR